MVAFSPDGRWLVSGGSEGQTLLWDTRLARATPIPLPGHSLGVYAVAFAPDSQWLATADDSGLIRVWNLVNPNENTLLRGHRSNVRGLAFLATAVGPRLLSTGYDGTVRLWDYQHPEASPLLLRGHGDSINLLAATPQSNHFATTSYDGAVRWWDVDEPYAQPAIVAYTGAPVSELTLTRDGQNLVWSALDEAIVQVIDPTTNHLRYALPGLTSTVAALAVSPDGALLATGDEAGLIHLWRLGRRNTRQRRSAVMLQPSKALRSAQMASPWPAPAMIGGATLGCGNRRGTRHPDGHTDTVMAVAFSPDGQSLASAGLDGAVRLWNTATGATIADVGRSVSRLAGAGFPPRWALAGWRGRGWGCLGVGPCSVGAGTGPTAPASQRGECCGLQRRRQAAGQRGGRRPGQRVEYCRWHERAALRWRLPA